MERNRFGESLKIALMSLAWSSCDPREPVIHCQAYENKQPIFSPDSIALSLESKTARLASTTDRLRTGHVVSRDGVYEITFPTLPGAMRLFFRIDPATGAGERELGNDPALGVPTAVLRHSITCTGDLAALTQIARREVP